MKRSLLIFSFKGCRPALIARVSVISGRAGVAVSFPYPVQTSWKPTVVLGRHKLAKRRKLSMISLFQVVNTRRALPYLA